MERRNFLPIFSLFLFLSIAVLLLARVPLFSGLGFVSNPLFNAQYVVFSALTFPAQFFSDKKLSALQAENIQLRTQLVHDEKLQADNAALRDQFETTQIPSNNLLPAQVIGDPNFIPGISNPETLIVQKGKKDGVAVGQPVVYKNNLIGQITSSADTASLVTLVSNKVSSFTVRTSETRAQGVLTGQGDGVMILGNVVLSDTLRIGDTVLTNGSQDTTGHGYPPDLVVGKIVSVNKNASSLYQSASVESLLNISKLTNVFILVNH